MVDSEYRVTVRERLKSEPGTGVYEPLGDLLGDFTVADRGELVARIEGEEWVG